MTSFQLFDRSSTRFFEFIGGADEQNMNYYQEYCKLFVANVVLTNQVLNHT